TPGPVYVRSVRCPVPVIFPESHVMELGKGVELHKGQDIAVISSGMMTPKALEAVEMLEKEGLHARLIHMGSIKPLDQEIIVKAARDCGHIVTVENHSVIGGLGGAVAETLCDLHPCRLTRIGFPDIFMESGDDEEIFTSLGMNPPEIAAKVRSLVKRSLP
ncbi:MAG: transketolase, partial [Spirochaetales bacterium]|nr:transketolase [Spirochaetales bacterium]